MHAGMMLHLDSIALEDRLPGVVHKILEDLVAHVRGPWLGSGNQSRPFGCAHTENLQHSRHCFDSELYTLEVPNSKAVTQLPCRGAQHVSCCCEATHTLPNLGHCTASHGR